MRTFKLKSLSIVPHLLYHSAQANFYHESNVADCFEPADPRDRRRVIKGGFMFFCNTYLEAALLASCFEQEFGSWTMVLHALVNEFPDDDEYVVIANKTSVERQFKSKKGSRK